MLASVHPIVFGCYSSVYEFSNITMSYIGSFNNTENLIVSAVHKAGDLYDTI